MRKKCMGLLGLLLTLGITGMVWAGDGACPSSTSKDKTCQTAAAVDPQPGSAVSATDSKPAETKPAETKPIETKPAPAAEPAPMTPETAAGSANLQVEEIAIATGVENRAPVGAAETFPAATEKLYCYTKLIGGEEGNTIVHKWSHAGEVAAEVTLKVNGSPWRTYSSKALGENAAGAWTVDIVENGNVIKTVKFEVTQ